MSDETTKKRIDTIEDTLGEHAENIHKLFGDTGRHEKQIVEWQGVKTQRDEEIDTLNTKFSSLDTKLEEGNKIAAQGNELKQKQIEEGEALRKSLEKFGDDLKADMKSPKYAALFVVGTVLFGFLWSAATKIPAAFEKALSWLH